jgi:hypothetical protein
VAVVRASWAANPGLYLVSNRTGDWVTTRFDGVFDAMGPQLAIDAAGHATIVLGRSGGAGLSAFDQTEASAPSVAAGDARHQGGHIEGEQTRGGRLAADGSDGGIGSGASPPTVPNGHGSGPTP